MDIKEGIECEFSSTDTFEGRKNIYTERDDGLNAGGTAIKKLEDFVITWRDESNLLSTLNSLSDIVFIIITILMIFTNSMLKSSYEHSVLTQRY